jgi:large subunit ribosomal protein L17
MRKLQRPTDQRIALMKNLATNLLWYSRIETTLEKAKDVQSYAEKLLTVAINTYEDTVKTTKKVLNDKGVTSNREVINDGPKKTCSTQKING